MNKKLLLLSLVSVSLGGIKAEDVETINPNNMEEMNQPETQKSCRRCCRHKSMSPAMEGDTASQEVHHESHHHKHHGMQEVLLRGYNQHKKVRHCKCGTFRARCDMKNQNNVMLMPPVFPANPATKEVAIAPETMQTDENQMVQDEDAEMQKNQMPPVVDVTEDVVEVPENVEVVPEVEGISVVEEPVDAAQ